MKKLSKNEWVAVSVAVLFVAYMFFGGQISNFLGLFTSSDLTASVAGSDTPSVQTQDLVVGNGAEIKPGMQVGVNYVLRLGDGTLIQDSRQVSGGQAFKFITGSGQLIPGWEQGILGMRVGGKRVIIIPPALGYGSQAVGPIPANSTLIFEIEVVEASLPN